mmetsp:Transcript_115197/g.229460  ORF Transcript_115197/g.229460 Transcript_115197/m.229460 type:complete len:109 (-) Transcript_115197:168-494(-)
MLQISQWCSPRMQMETARWLLLRMLLWRCAQLLLAFTCNADRDGQLAAHDVAAGDFAQPPFHTALKPLETASWLLVVSLHSLHSMMGDGHLAAHEFIDGWRDGHLAAQ